MSVSKEQFIHNGALTGDSGGRRGEEPHPLYGVFPQPTVVNNLPVVPEVLERVKLRYYQSAL